MRDRRLTLLSTGAFALALLSIAPSANAQTLRLLTWNSYAPDNVVQMFEKKYPDIKAEVKLAKKEDRIAKLRATGGAGFDLAQPSHDRINAVQTEYGVYKPLDLSKIDVAAMDDNLLNAVKANTTIDGKVYAIPFQWGT